MTVNQDKILDITRHAGHAIMKIYSNLALASDVDYKDDKSPLTLADRASHEVIMAELKEAFPDVPVLSEEGAGIPYEVRKEYEYYWLVDPLDGTKEFINRNGEFTVNIALIHERVPVAGFIYAPVLDTFYMGTQEGAWKIKGTEKVALEVNNKSSDRIAVRSKSHASPEEEDVLDRYEVSDSISVGSSLKFCMVAEGKADIYYRHGPTMEWDTAAGHAIVEAAGGKVLKGTGPDPFTYNKENLLNSSFLCLGF